MPRSKPSLRTRHNNVLRGLDLVIAKLHCSEAEVTKLELAAEVLSLGVVDTVNTAPAENV